MPNRELKTSVWLRFKLLLSAELGEAQRGAAGAGSRAAGPPSPSARRFPCPDKQQFSGCWETGSCGTPEREVQGMGSVPLPRPLAPRGAPCPWTP